MCCCTGPGAAWRGLATSFLLLYCGTRYASYLLHFNSTCRKVPGPGIVKFESVGPGPGHTWLLCRELRIPYMFLWLYGTGSLIAELLLCEVPDKLPL